MESLACLTPSMRRAAMLALLITLAASASGANSPAKKDIVIHAFQGGSDGVFPFAGLISDAAGNLYGTTTYGGGPCAGAGCGTVFKLAPPTSLGGLWTESVIYSFGQGATDGAGPYGGLTFDKVGNLYGTTSGGGENPACPNCGTVFQLMPPSAPGDTWTEHILHRFQDDPDGAGPWGPLIFDSTGNLYGTTSAGGPGESGTVFRMTPPAVAGGDWMETVLYRFDILYHPGEGYNPLSGVIMDKAGDLYGTTEEGGKLLKDHCQNEGCGIVFELIHPVTTGGAWTYRVLHRFKNSPNDGAYPMAGLVFDQLGNLYGTTFSGGNSKCKSYFIQPCGLIFRLAPPFWDETVIYNLTGGNDGFNPEGSLVFHNGSLYGTTADGGVGDCPPGGGCGTIFKLAPPENGSGNWTETVLYRFRGGSEGGVSSSNVLFGKGDTLFVPTTTGGSSEACTSYDFQGCGTVVELLP